MKTAHTQGKMRRTKQRTKAVMTPDRAFDIVHELLHLIDGRNHDKICEVVDGEHVMGLVCYTDRPRYWSLGRGYKRPELSLTLLFLPNECEMRQRYAIPDTLEEITLLGTSQRISYQSPELFRSVLQWLDESGLKVRAPVFRTADTWQEGLTR